jgi:hypothetical protein
MEQQNFSGRRRSVPLIVCLADMFSLLIIERGRI